MSGLNRCEFIGHLGRDPEIRYTQSGEPVATLNLAVSEAWKDRDSGERKEKTEWITIVIFNQNLASVAERFGKKGSKVYAAGKFQTRKWTDKNGQDRYSSEIVIGKFGGELIFLDKRGDDDAPAESRQGKDWSPPTSHELDDEIPF